VSAISAGGAVCFFPDLGKQPGLGRGGCPALLRMIVGEAAGLKDDGAQFGDAAANNCR